MNRNHSKSRELVRRRKATTTAARADRAIAGGIMCSQFDWDGGP